MTKGRNGPVRAILEPRIYLGFLGHFNIIAKLVPQIRNAKVMRRWKDGEHAAGIAPQHDCLGQSIPRKSDTSAVRADAMAGSCGITSSAFKYRWSGGLQASHH